MRSIVKTLLLVGMSMSLWSCKDDVEETESGGVVGGASLQMADILETNNVNALEQYLANGGAVDAVDEAGNTTLHLAALHGSAKVGKILISKGVTVDALNTHGETPLIIATREGHIPMITMLLRQNASPDIKDQDGFRPVTVAAQDGATQVIEALALYSRKYLDDALFIAALKGHSEMIDSLTNHGASVYSRLDEDGRTPLMLAAQNGHIETVRVLLENGANRYSTDMAGNTASVLASEAGHGAVAEYLGETPEGDGFALVEQNEEVIKEAVLQVAAADDEAAQAAESGAVTESTPITVKSLDGQTLSVNPEQPIEQVLEIKTYREESLPVQVAAVDHQKVTVKYLYGDHQTVDVHPGETIPHTDLKVMKATVKRDHSKMTDGKPADVSLVKVQDTQTGEAVEMTTGLEVGRSEPFAVVQARGQESYLVAKQGDLFKGEDGQLYEILEVRPKQLVIMNTKNGEVKTLQK